MKNNIVLIGMPGVGKSTIGVILAKELGYQFMDTDLIIQKKENRLLREIIEQEGVDGFLDVENQVNSGIEAERTVIATGGSAVYGREAMKHFREIGTIIYLRLPFEKLRERLGNLRGRGAVSYTHLDVYKRQLVNRLKGDEYSGLDAEQVALILAEKLIGGDSQFQTLAVPETRGGSRQNFRNDYSGAARRAKRTGRRSGPVTSAGRSAKHS